MCMLHKDFVRYLWQMSLDFWIPVVYNTEYKVLLLGGVTCRELL